MSSAGMNPHGSPDGGLPSNRRRPASASPKTGVTPRKGGGEVGGGEVGGGEVGNRERNGKVPHTIRTTIPSDFAAGRDVQKQILDAVDRNGFTAHSTFAVKLALEEALINAIKHGNKLDPHKRVHVEAIVTSTQAEITIEDEGTGFQRHSVPDPRSAENLEKCSGRGILLIEAYMNSVEWSRDGRRLRMIKRNGEEPKGR